MSCAGLTSILQPYLTIVTTQPAMLYLFLLPLLCATMATLGMASPPYMTINITELCARETIHCECGGGRSQSGRRAHYRPLRTILRPFARAGVQYVTA